MIKMTRVMPIDHHKACSAFLKKKYGSCDHFVSSQAAHIHGGTHKRDEAAKEVANADREGRDEHARVACLLEALGKLEQERSHALFLRLVVIVRLRKQVLTLLVDGACKLGSSCHESEDLAREGWLGWRRRQGRLDTKQGPRNSS